MKKLQIIGVFLVSLEIFLFRISGIQAAEKIPTDSSQHNERLEKLRMNRSVQSLGKVAFNLFKANNDAWVKEYASHFQGNAVIEVRDFVLAKQVTPKATVGELLRDYETRKKAALEHLIKRGRQKFDDKDVFATIYLMNYYTGFCWGGPLIQDIDAAKHLIALACLPFDQAILQTTAWLQTNTWGVRIDWPTVEQIEDAVTLRSRVPRLGQGEYLRELEILVTQRTTPLLDTLAKESTQLSIIFTNPQFSRGKDEQAQALILRAPESIRVGLKAKYEEFKARVKPSDSDYRTGIKNLRELRQLLLGEK